MKFVSTRGNETATGAEAVVRGIASDGGLYVPAAFPHVGEEEIKTLCEASFLERVAFILGLFFDEYPHDELLAAAEEGYARFEGEGEDPDPAPLLRMDDGTYVLELFHGPTCAFKDLPLAVLPYLLKKGCELCGIGENLLIPIATSGDTGKAALESFSGCEGVKVAVFYPEDGVSKMQKLQMVTTDGDNVDVVAVRGNFDDCQSQIKRIMNSGECREYLLKKGYRLTAANSINFARIAAQIAYYFSAYCDLVTSDQIHLGEEVDFAVPTGNFGNVLSAYYAKCMGLPVGTLVVASNRNAALTDFFGAGTYSVRRPLYRTMSPAMDILVSSNLERLLFEVSGRDTSLTAERMHLLATSGKFTIRTEELKALGGIFYAGSASEDDTVECIYDFFTDYGYPMDTHTGVAMCVSQRYRKKVEDDPNGVKRPMVVIATASPYKFPQDVLYALTGNDVKDSFKGVKRIHLLTAMRVPEALKSIRYKPPRFKTVVSPDKIFDEIKKFIG